MCFPWLMSQLANDILLLCHYLRLLLVVGPGVQLPFVGIHPHV